MTKYVVLNAPAYGHVNPTLAVVQELVARGEEVVYFNTEEFKEAIEATGATFRGYQSSMGQLTPPPFWGRANNPPVGGVLPNFMIEESRKVIPQALERVRAERPDYIIYDGMALWARIVIQVLNVPAIMLRPSYAANEHTNLFAAQMAEQRWTMPSEFFATMNPAIADLCATYNVPPLDMREIFSHSEPLTIVFLPRAFQPAGDTFDERFMFVGPSLQPRHQASDFPLEKLEKQPTLYISLGTVFNNQADFFNLCFSAFGDQPWQVVLSYGKRIDPLTLHAVPQNFLLSAYVPQLEVLSHTDIFVTHGGMNSTMESLYYGVPMIVIPQMMEQALTARRVEELGLGITLDRDTVTAQTLQEAVTRVSSDPTFRERTQAMQQEVRNPGGCLRAADAIMRFSCSHL
ncbi:MAG: glycosyl transferase [Ktedonobacteraceae bacterium]|nr:glycosyl transferase [Ktedonobacteraceae bacterium]